MSPSTNQAMIRDWRVRDFDAGKGLDAGATRGTGEGWLDIQAPGDLYLALVSAGRLEHPYRGRNEAAAAWVRSREWWWHGEITLPDAAASGPAELVCEGLDTFADIYLDGVLIGQADNMFRSWRFDLPAEASGAHDLAICFHPTYDRVADQSLHLFSAFTNRVSLSRRTLIRKAQFGWGWDWGPDLPTVGIWAPVSIQPRSKAQIRSVNFTTREIAGSTASIELDVDLVDDDGASVDVELLDPQGASVATATRRGAGAIDLSVPDAQLWWTADLGDQPLYTLVIRTPGAAEHRQQVGIRTVAVDQSPDPDEPGTTFFRFVLNGVPIFAKGANWIPASSFVAEVPAERYRDLLTRAVEGNMNMMRVWGGGIYERDVFYDECDRLGLLVWQDFMFACAPYPEAEAFLDNVRAEATEQVRRLRHRACLALWCGNNENQGIQHFVDHANGRAEPLIGLVIYDDLLPGLLRTLDPQRPYWPSSPWGGPSPNSMRGGDEHNWTVWHGTPPIPDADVVGEFETSPEGVAYTRYEEDMARFVSEFGLQSAPDIATLRRWMAPEDLKLGSDGFLERIKDKTDKATAMMLPITGAPATIEQFVDFTMLSQAEGLKFGIEHFRRRKPHCSGALIWQHNDCWPCVSWSLIDYDGVAKASWYAVRRAFAPVLASFRRVGDAVELWITNDTLAPIDGSAAVALARLEGASDWQRDVAFHVPANGSACVWREAVAPANERVLTVRSASGLFPDNRLLLAAVKDLALALDPGLSVELGTADDGLPLTIASDHYALAVRIRSDDPELRFDENHFDLAAGERRQVMVTRVDGGPVNPKTIEVSCFNARMG
ncbi:beta-mannosidase [Sphingomonas sp. Y38-1Y]|uniref:beta-mannosidase n=1 Tax=Sphingomonas sp. Y38-1Y TaxID=3078265 RepID=UPI0028EAE3DC|nr:glycoside hydrolase family 2 protein [Sphingomonas sp. Y38-1Y]